jgi:drug/metabolite transporter (DMT)-like permease
MSVPFALSSAAAYGAGDFAGGLAARRTPVLTVTAVAQAAGLAALLPAALLVPGHITGAALGIGALAGVSGMAGLLLYMRGLAVGPMGLVAPLSSVVGAGLPLVAGVLGGERPGGVAWLALAVALVAIGLASAGSRGDAAAGAGLAYGLGAGVGFGLFFVAIAWTPDDAGLWPLVAGRVVSVSLLVAVLLVRRRRGRLMEHGRRDRLMEHGRPGRPVGVRLMLLCGVLDTTANVLFLLATRTGALSVSGVLVSLYPVVVVVLARVVLRERLTGLQLTGVGLALTASALLASAS